MSAITNLTSQTLENIREGKHREAYGLFVVGVALVILGLFNIVSSHTLLSIILLALTFLVFDTASDRPSQPPELDLVLQSRETFGPFSKLLPGLNDLRIYGPTAVNVLVASADIRRFILDRGGTVRVIIEEQTPEAISSANIQLDDNLDFEQTLRSSEATLAKLATSPGFNYRLLPINPGFSLLIANADDPDGYIIFESQGFKDENIADRMHIVIRRQDSPKWFFYWIARYDAMWTCAVEPLTPVADEIS